VPTPPALISDPSVPSVPPAPSVDDLSIPPTAPPLDIPPSGDLASDVSAPLASNPPASAPADVVDAMAGVTLSRMEQSSVNILMTTTAGMTREQAIRDVIAKRKPPKPPTTAATTSPPVDPVSSPLIDVDAVLPSLGLMQRRRFDHLVNFERKSPEEAIREVLSTAPPPSRPSAAAGTPGGTGASPPVDFETATADLSPLQKNKVTQLLRTLSLEEAVASVKKDAKKREDQREEEKKKKDAEAKAREEAARPSWKTKS
jgi:hypothetical protein